MMLLHRTASPSEAQSAGSRDENAVMLAVALMVFRGWICGAGKADQAKGECFGDESGAARNAKLEENTLDGLFHGSRGAAKRFGDLLIGEA